MAYEVFISYASPDSILCDEVYKLIERIGYIPFRDCDDFTAGQHWLDQIREALGQSDIAPYVVVLCTNAASANPENIVKEICFAREKQLTVIPVEFDEGVTKVLLESAGYANAEGIHYIDGKDPAGRNYLNNRIEVGLRWSLTLHVRNWLNEQRVLAKDWSVKLNPTISFWEISWRDFFGLGSPPGRMPDSVALTARGGSGKSFLIAQCVRHLLTDPQVYPVIIVEAMLRNAARELPRKFGARSEDTLSEQIQLLAMAPPGDNHGWKPMNIVFVVDGLDQMVTPGDLQQKRLVDGLKLLVNSASALIGCRREVWQTTYSSHVSVQEKEVPELDERRVGDLLRAHTTLPSDRINPLLQVPFFLDIALRKSGVWEDVPRTETGFLQRIWSDAVNEGSPGRQVLPGDTGRTWLLENLAAYQLDRLTYEIPLAELRKRPGFMPNFATSGLQELKAAGLLVEQPSPAYGAGPTVRLWHDLLDNYSMLRVLQSGPNPLEKRRELCRRCDKGCGWSLMAMLVQAAHDWGNEALKRELFAEFLFLLDHKKFCDEAMTRAWAVTHVLKACFQPLFGLIMEALRGQPVESLNRNDPAHIELRRSELGPSPHLTQEAASTLLSAFMVLQTAPLEDAATVVTVLARGLATWELKFRVIDALGKYHNAAALEAIVTFGRRQLRERDDVPTLLCVARNLRHFQQEAASELLRDMVVDTTLNSRLRYVAAKSLNHLLPGQVEVPPLDEGDIVIGLAVRELGGVRYTDWYDVQENAEYVRDRIVRGDRFGPRVLEALIQALAHDHTFVRRAVAQTLMHYDESAARDALLNEVLELAIPAEVRSACRDALAAQMRRQADPRTRQVCRYLFLRAAGAASQLGDVLTEQALIDLALNPGLRTPDDWLLTNQAVEVVPPANAPWLERCSVKAEEVEPGILRELEEVGSEDVGPNREPKYRFADLKPVGEALGVSLAPTTWQEGKNFHNAVQQHPDRFLRDAGRWLVPLPLGEARLPGLAAVHVIVLTADNRLLLAQRSAKLAYAPLHWSASFEEQVTEPDVRYGSRVFHRAAQRGMIEEFGIDVDPSRIHLMSVLLEMHNLNLGAVVMIDAAQTLEQIRRSWLGEPRPSDAWETEALDSTDAGPLALDELAGGAEFRLGSFHPTSRMRCALLARWLRLRARE